jgi:hypothetical protein
MSTSAFSGNNGDLVLYPRTSATSKILLMGGNVGIGTTNPVGNLMIQSSATTTATTSQQAYDYSRFNYCKSKEQTARIAIWRELGCKLPNIFTMEASFCGPKAVKYEPHRKNKKVS